MYKTLVWSSSVWSSHMQCGSSVNV